MKNLGKIISIVILCSLGLYLALPKNVDKETEEAKVLFIGNSYTYTGNIPKLVKQIAKANLDDLEYYSHTSAGAKIADHLDSKKLERVLTEKKWSFVVIQTQSTELIQTREHFEKVTTTQMKQLVEKIRLNAPESEILLFGTWASKNGRIDECKSLPHMCNFTEMNDKLIERQTEISKSVEIALIPITDSWAKINRSQQDIHLYADDGSHPSAHGAYLSALHFYSYLFHKNPTNNQYRAKDLNERKNQYINKTTKETFHKYYGKNFFGK